MIWIFTTKQFMVEAVYQAEQVMAKDGQRKLREELKKLKDIVLDREDQ